jgi:endonuclease/exonuclease/phosphatase family metal-dependent hydrolase
VSIIAALWLCGCSTGVHLESIGEDDLCLRIMSFNIRYGTADDGENKWQNRKNVVCGVLRDNQPDIVSLQEALHFQIQEILQVLPEFNYLGVGREDGKTKGEYCVILYRTDRFDSDDSGTFWFSDTPEVPDSITWGNANTRICTWARFIDKKSGMALYIFNLHLDHVSQPSREKSVVLLTNRIYEREHQSDPYVVTGDFNAGETNPAVMYLKARAELGGVPNPVPMVDTFRVLHPDATMVGTFHGFKGSTTGEKIDYILTTQDVEVLDAQIIRTQYNGRYPSDHFPVTARLYLPTRGK